MSREKKLTPPPPPDPELDPELDPEPDPEPPEHSQPGMPGSTAAL